MPAGGERKRRRRPLLEPRVAFGLAVVLLAVWGFVVVFDAIDTDYKLDSGVHGILVLVGFLLRYALGNEDEG